MTSPEQLIRFDEVSKFYGEALGVNRVTLALEPGITSLVGPNGAGKSTLMNLMTGLLAPTRGTIRVLGNLTTDLERLHEVVGYCPQFDAFPRGLTGLDLIASFLAVRGHSRRDARDIAWRAIEKTGMTEAARRRIGSYSKGMRQRIKLALAMAHSPRAIVLDEPLNGLDPMARAEAIALFQSFAEDGMHVIISSHIMHEVDLIADRIVMMSGGYVVADGGIQSVRGEMEQDHPIRILVRCDQPRIVAAAAFSDGGAIEVQIHADGQGLIAATRDVNRFYALLHRAVLDRGVVIETVAPADDNAHAVYQYLMGTNGGHQL
ncbi:MAG TPA: ABC transporter ATP-binding protein [Terriglobia bacterium]|nr:ABC transporter ATP-binding protein [Terriglobia bacterium]